MLMSCPNCGGADAGNRTCPRCGEKLTASAEGRVSLGETREFSSQHRRRRTLGSLFKGGTKLLLVFGLCLVSLATALDPETGLRRQLNYLTDQPDRISDVAFPGRLEEPKTVHFAWSYKGRDYAVAETLYGNIAAYYRDHPVKSFYEDEAEEEYYGNFAANLFAAEDGTLARLAADIRAAGEREGLTEEQTLELAVAFVQAIPYDEAKYQVVARGKDGDAEATWPRFPYEVLYDDMGICTDKTLLAVALADELGYGTALLSFDAEQHMAPAIQCTPEYSSYGSGYCYTEVTSTGFRIGDAQVGGLEAGKALTRAAKPDAASALADVRIYGRKEGKTYGGVVQTRETLARIDELGARVEALKADVAARERTCQSLKDAVQANDEAAEQAYSRYRAQPKAALYEKYRQAYQRYSEAYDRYSKEYDAYQSQVAAYNRAADEYNGLINTFYG